MPLVNFSVTVPCLRYTYSFTGVQVGDPVALTYTFDKHNIDAPLSSYRTKPADLWGSGTSRTVTNWYTATTCGPMLEDGKLYRYTARPLTGLYLTDYLTPPSLTLPDRNAMYNRVRNQVRGNAVNLAMCLAEYSQTAELFHSLVKVVTSRGKSLARGFAGTKQASRTIAKRYLAYQYGVRPLCSDMIGSYEALKQASATRQMVQKGVVRSMVRGERNTIASPSSGTMTGTASANISKLVIYKTAYRATMSPNTLNTVLARHGFTNPISLGYELVPYSFVLDWWTNVGDVLASLDNLLLIQSLMVRDSSRTTTIWDVSAANKNVNGSYKIIKITDSRSAPTAISRINSFQYKPSASLTHILNGLALLRNARKS